MFVTNDPSAVWVRGPENMAQPDVDMRIRKWVLSKYRDKHQAGGRMENHLSTCPSVEVLTYELGDSYYNCDCPSDHEYFRLEAVLKCSHGVRRDFEFGDFGLVEDVLSELEAWERRVREQTGNPALIVGKLPDNGSVVPMIVVYHNTVDYPGLYVARRHDIGVGIVAIHPEPLAVAASLEQVRAVVPRGMIPIEPVTDDDPCIVEVYL